MNFKFKEGDRVLYDGIIGIVESFWNNGKWNNYDLVSEEDNQLTTTAKEIECTLVSEDEEIDTSEAMSNIIMRNKSIQNMVGGLTDSHFRDGCH
jgi:hypothetical protein